MLNKNQLSDAVCHTNGQLFAPAVAPESDSERARVAAAQGFDRLRVWMPDTLVFDRARPYWLYCSKDGVVQR